MGDFWSNRVCYNRKKIILIFFSLLYERLEKDSGVL